MLRKNNVERYRALIFRRNAKSFTLLFNLPIIINPLLFILNK